jgi:hypothetical protein
VNLSTITQFYHFKYFILNLGRFIGDFPAEDPKKPCNVEADCTEENQTCHDMGRWGGFCGTKTCQTKTDCFKIGHVVHGIFSAIGCNDGLCEYSTSQAIAWDFEYVQMGNKIFFVPIKEFIHPKTI